MSRLSTRLCIYELWELLLEAVQATGEKVYVVEALLEDDATLKDAMPFIVVVDDEDLVRFVFVNAQLGKLLVSLNVFGGETDCVGDVRLGKFTLRSQV